MSTVYILSGPLGVGKSTAAKELAASADNTELIVGDDFMDANESSGLEWDQRLRDAWNNITKLSRESLSEHRDVVIDFVVEDELEWFCKQIADFNPTIKYIVLVADKDRVLERLAKRGHLRYKARSLFLLDKLSNDPANAKFLYDTTEKTSTEVVQELTGSSQYIVG